MPSKQFYIPSDSPKLVSKANMVKNKNLITYLLIVSFLLLSTFVVLYFDFYSFINDIEKDFWSDASDSPVVQTLSGAVKGTTVNVSDRNVFAFVGIRYAEPPIGDLRFASPQPIRQWTDVRPALEFTPMCPQVIIPKTIIDMNYISENISEDCLSLNIWTPDLKPKTLKTVMVWIHGGGFLYNSANIKEKDGRILAGMEDVVVVTINYRYAFTFEYK